MKIVRTSGPSSQRHNKSYSQHSSTVQQPEQHQRTRACQQEQQDWRRRRTRWQEQEQKQQRRRHQPAGPGIRRQEDGGVWSVVCICFQYIFTFSL